MKQKTLTWALYVPSCAKDDMMHKSYIIAYAPHMTSNSHRCSPAQQICSWTYTYTTVHESMDTVFCQTDVLHHLRNVSSTLWMPFVGAQHAWWLQEMEGGSTQHVNTYIHKKTLSQPVSVNIEQQKCHVQEFIFMSNRRPTVMPPRVSSHWKHTQHQATLCTIEYTKSS